MLSHPRHIDWGLRDYGLEGVEWPAVTYAPLAGLPPLDIPGCDPECEHVWVTEITKRGSGGEREYGSYDGAVGRGPAVKLPAAQYCQLCGGWRGSLGLEPDPAMFVGHIVLVARELWRVLRDDGTFWLNFGDSYAAQGGSKKAGQYEGMGHVNSDVALGTCDERARRAPVGLKPKDLIGIPWRVAFALQADGWYLRSDIIWAKGVSFCPTYSGSCMPESVRDRPTTGHEHVFLLAKRKRYFYDGDAVREESGDFMGGGSPVGAGNHNGPSFSGKPTLYERGSGRNLRTVWTINPGSYAGAHFATFPPALVEPMIKAGTSAKGCCPECGDPWVRVVERIRPTNTDLESVAYRSDQATGSRRIPGRQDEPLQSIHASKLRGQEWSALSSNHTTGWTPTCSCYDWEHCAVCGAEMDEYDKEHGDRLDCGHNVCAECLMVGEAAAHVRECALAPVPCTVLDPFLGSGTTVEVADFLGRHSVGIELSKSYCDDHIIPRLTEPLFEWAAQEPEQEPEPEIEQMELL